MRVGRYPEAIREFETYARLRPHEPNPHDSLGEAYLIAGQPQHAIDRYARALELDPTFISSRNGRAMAFGMLGRFDEAIAEERTFREDHKGKQPTFLFGAYFLEPYFLTRAGGTGKATRSFAERSIYSRRKRSRSLL